MVQALKTGEIDYVRGVGADQFDALEDEPNIETGRRLRQRLHLARLQHARATPRATAARRRRSSTRRSATPSATPSTTRSSSTRPRRPRRRRARRNVPPLSTRTGTSSRRHPRTFDIDEAKQRLDAAGYTLDATASALDKEGKPINLRLTWPDSDAANATNAQFIQPAGSAELGIEVDAAVTEEGKLIDDRDSARAATGQAN